MIELNEKLDYKQIYIDCKNQKEYNIKNKLRHSASLPFKAPINFLEDLMKEFSRVKLKEDSNGKISATEVLNTLKQDNLDLAYALALINYLPRSSLYYGNASLNARYCSLVPLFMSAHKEFNHVNYESWDKTDPNLREIMGYTLYDDIMPYIHKITGVDDEIESLRNKALNYLSKDGPKAVPATSWPKHTVHLSPSLKWKGTNLARHIKLQTWMANVVHRNKYMILDTINWDNVPVPMDVQGIPPEADKKDFDPFSNIQEEHKLPF